MVSTVFSTEKVGHPIPRLQLESATIADTNIRKEICFLAFFRIFIVIRLGLRYKVMINTLKITILTF